MDNTNIQFIQNLLTQIHVIQKKYDDIAEITGENFNIFKILKLEAHEVKTHSAFLAELLNPMGSHSLKDAFLKLFIEIVVSDDVESKFHLSNFDTMSAVAHVEFYTGQVSDTEGGRIDILIKSQQDNIIIENKIYAEDQPFQMVRYNNHNPNAPLFYLTLYGNTPSDGSKGKLKENKDFKCISYENEIIKWLEKCREKAVNHAILRESLTQYINLIKFLTGKTLNNRMEKEIFDVIKRNPEFIETILSIPSKRYVKIELLRQFANKLVDEINKKEALIESVSINAQDNYIAIDFKVEGWKDAILPVFYNIKNDNFRGIEIGIYLRTQMTHDERVIESKKFRDKIDPLVKDLGIGKILSSDKGWNNWVMLHKFDKMNFNDDPKIWRNLYATIGEFTQKTIVEIIKRVENQGL